VQESERVWIGVKWNPSGLRAKPMMDRPVRRWERNSMMYASSCFTTARCARFHWVRDSA